MRIIKYWLKLPDVSTPNCILNTVYNSMLLDITRATPPRQDSWLAKVKQLLDRNGVSEIWYYPHSVKKELFLPTFKRRLIDNFINELRRELEVSGSMSLHRELSQDVELSQYLNKIHNRTHRKALAKLHMSSHGLLIETGTHTGIAQENRKCTLCNKNDIKDQYHFV